MTVTPMKLPLDAVAEMAVDTFAATDSAAAMLDVGMLAVTVMEAAAIVRVMSSAATPFPAVAAN